MATKKLTEKKNKTVKKKSEKKVVKKAVKEEHYFYAVGRRKTAVAKIKLFPSKNTQNAITTNGKKAEDYFPIKRLVDIVYMPFTSIGESTHFKVEIKLTGGGTSAQAEASRLGIARALIIFDETLKKLLKDEGFLTRDSRKVERKKAGLKKARRAPQWSKR